MLKFIAAPLILIVCLVAVACGGGKSQPESTNIKRDIVGSWNCSANSFNNVHAADGSAAASNEVTISSDWSVSNKVISSSGKEMLSGSSEPGASLFPDSNHVVAVWESTNPEYEVHIRGDEMELVAGDGSKTTCKRK